MDIPIHKVRLGGKRGGASPKQVVLNARRPLLFRPVSHWLAWSKHYQDPRHTDY